MTKLISTLLKEKFKGEHMNILVLGAGRMAYGLVFDFLKNENIKRITVIDNVQSALDDMKVHFNNSKLNFNNIAADNLKDLKPFFDNASGAISAESAGGGVRLLGLGAGAALSVVVFLER